MLAEIRHNMLQTGPSPPIFSNVTLVNVGIGVVNVGLWWEGVSTLGYWKKHQSKDIEKVLREYDQCGWRIEDPPKYYRVKCPCGKHQRSVHLTPSGPDYAKNLRAWLHRQACYVNREAKKR